MSAMTPERLEAVREHLETTGYSHAFKPQAFELLEEVDRLRAGIKALMARPIPHETYESGETECVAAYDLLDLLNPTEGDDR